MKSHKGEGTKLNQAKGGVVSGDREPLFPRLHVNETEKAGPKAPPRNKMALYEQFTVPSQQFQPAQGSTSTVLLQPYGSGYHCIPYYIPSVAHGSAQAYAQPSQVTNSSGITKGSMVVNEDSRKAPRHHKTSSSSPGKLLRVFTEASAECITTDVQEQKGTPKFSMTKTINEGTSFFQNAPVCKERPDISTKTESSHEVVSALKDDMESTHERNNGFNSQKGYFPASPEPPGETSKINTVLPKLQTLILGSKHSCTAKSSRCDKRSSEQHGMASELRNSERKGAIPDGEYKDQLSAKNQGLSSVIVSNERPRICSSERQYSSGVKKADNNKEAEHVNSDVEGFEELKREESNPEVSHHTGEPSYDADDISLLLKPKDVIFAIGQQQFWKARKMLLRQQKIFSDQVFQLHKLIMTQQLLAQTPGTLIDEAMHLETKEDCHAPTPAPSAKGAAKRNGCDSDEGCSGKGSKSQACDADPQPLSKDGEREVKVGMAETTPGRLSAWGYPSLNPWLCPAGFQAQPYGYPPMNGALAPGSVFGLPYGSTLSGSPSPISFGIPFCGQQQEVLAEIGSNYGPAAVSKLGASGLKSHNFGPFPNEFASSWYLMQHGSLNQNRIQCSGSGKDGSTGSGASVNKASPSGAQRAKASCFPGLLQNWSLGSQAVGASNTEGFDSSGPQSESSSPSIATKLACSASHLTSATPATKKIGLKEDQATGHNNNIINLNRSQSCDSRKSSPFAEEEEVEARASSKVLKDSCRALAAGDGAVEHSTCVGGSALELFPLVPSLSYSGQNCEQDSKLVKMIGQGSVIRAVPRRAIAASETTASILLALQQERRK